MTRGEIVTVAAPAPGPYTGKPRPAVVIQSDMFNPTHPSVTVCRLTTNPVAAPLVRVRVAPSVQNGLVQASQVMVDKVVTVPKGALRHTMGVLEDGHLLEVEQALRRWLDL